MSSDPRKFGDEVATLKARIQERVQEAVLQFFLATGLTPSDITVDMERARQNGDAVERYMVRGVTVEFRQL